MEKKAHLNDSSQKGHSHRYHSDMSIQHHTASYSIIHHHIASPSSYNSSIGHLWANRSSHKSTWLNCEPNVSLNESIQDAASAVGSFLQSSCFGLEIKIHLFGALLDSRKFWRWFNQNMGPLVKRLVVRKKLSWTTHARKRKTCCLSSFTKCMK